MMNREELEFQLELERFKQKALWETKIFFVALSFLISLLIYHTQTNKIPKEEYLFFLGGIGLILLLGELFINSYLEKQKEDLKKKFT